MTRRPGSANVEEHPKGSGFFRVRARIDGNLITIASKLTRKLADATADAYGVLRDESALRHGITVAQFGGGFLDRRERAGIRGIRQERSKWTNAVERDPIGAIALSQLRRSDVVEWRDRMLAHLAPQTVKNGRNLLCAALAEALDRELVTENVARDVSIPKRRGVASVEDLDGVLYPDEQLALMGAAPDRHKALVAVALLTGLRWSELSWLRREDVQGDEILVQRSTGGGPTKSGKARRVPLLGPARTALDVQLASLPAACPWVFPGSDGEPRQGRPLDWKKWVTAAGIERRVRWHDLRHTCATSLLAGWWSPDGVRWTLDEVCAMLGHSSISVTERYARKLDETLRLAAARGRFPGGNGNGGSEPESGPHRRLPKPQVRCSNHRGGAAGKQPYSHADRDDQGTSWELPRALKSALRKTTTRTPEGMLVRRIVRAWPHLLAGDETAAEPELASALRQLGLVVGGGR